MSKWEYSKNKGRKKLFLNYLVVRFHCVQLLLENFLMNAGSSNYPTVYHESNGTIFKIKCWFRRKRANPFHVKKRCIYQLTCPWNTVCQKLVEFLKQQFYGFQNHRIMWMVTKLVELLKLGFYWIYLSWLVHFLLSCTKAFCTEKPHREESLVMLELLWKHQSQ